MLGLGSTGMEGRAAELWHAAENLSFSLLVLAVGGGDVDCRVTAGMERRPI